MLWKPPTEQEKHIMKEFRDVFRDIVKADAEGLLYIRDIKDKFNKAAKENGGRVRLDEYLLDTYGIKLTLADDGISYLPTYEIADEQKYLIFMMKF